MSKSPRLGLALGGGGARGAAHIGVLEELEQAGIEIDCIAGTSAGSLVGALYSLGLSPEQILALALNTTWQDLMHLTLPRLGLSNANRMEILLNDLFHSGNIEDLPIPFAAVACDLRTGREVVLKTGNVAKAIRASSSIPGIFIPVHLEEHLLVDGGIVNGVPVNVVRELGATVVIAVKLHDGVEPVTHLDNIFAILTQSLEIMQRSQQMALPEVLIVPEVYRNHIGDLSKIAENYAAGRRAAKEALPAIKAALALGTESTLPLRQEKLSLATKVSSLVKLGPT